MKVSNTVVAGIVIAAVLVFAYGLGLLIRQARTGGPQGQKSAEGDKAAVAPHAEPRVARTKDTPEERARIKEERAKAREKMNAATPEQKEEFRNQLTKRVTGRRGSGGPQVGPVPEEAQATPTPSAAEAGPPKQDANTPASSSEKTNAKPSTDKTGKTGSESGKAGPG